MLSFVALWLLAMCLVSHCLIHSPRLIWPVDYYFYCSTLKSSGRRSRAMCSAFFSVCAAGNTDSSLASLVWRSQADQTRLADLVIRLNRDMLYIVSVSAVEDVRSQSTRYVCRMMRRSRFVVISRDIPRWMLLETANYELYNEDGPF